MHATEELPFWVSSGYLPPNGRSSSAAACIGSQEPSIPEQSWDTYNLSALLSVQQAEDPNHELGFLLRHYWIPVTLLTFKRSCQVTYADGTATCVEASIHRRMVRCRSGDCIWREKVSFAAEGPFSQGDRELGISETLCCYDRYEQSYRTKQVLSFDPPVPRDATEAKRAALLRLPIVVPPGPVPVGFCWYGRVEDDYMSFRLDAEERVGETTVLVIRREGRIAVRDLADSPVVVEREGITLFAPGRSVVLEDRCRDRIVDGNGDFGSCVGATACVVTRLTRSAPDDAPPAC